MGWLGTWVRYILDFNLAKQSRRYNQPEDTWQVTQRIGDVAANLVATDGNVHYNCLKLVVSALHPLRKRWQQQPERYVKCQSVPVTLCSSLIFIPFPLYYRVHVHLPSCGCRHAHCRGRRVPMWFSTPGDCRCKFVSSRRTSWCKSGTLERL